MRVLVTGGSGFLGREVTSRLVAAGHEVRVLARGRRPVQAGVEFVAGSVLDPASLPAACAGCEGVIHLVGIISELREQTFEAVHTGGTRALLQAAVGSGVRHWVQVSALGSRPQAPARYHRSKWEAEELVRASGLVFTIFRPSLVYGPGDGFTNLFRKLSRWSPVLPLIGGGNSLVQPVAVADVARCLVSALTLPAAAGRTLDLCGPDRLSYREVIRAVLRASGRRRLLVPIPWLLARVQAWVLERVWPLVLGQAAPLNRDQLKMLAEDNVGDPGPAAAVFGFAPQPFRP